MCSAAGWLPLCRVDQLVRSGDRIAFHLAQQAVARRPRWRCDPGVRQCLCSSRVDHCRGRPQRRLADHGLSVSPMGLPARRFADRRSARRGCRSRGRVPVNRAPRHVGRVRARQPLRFGSRPTRCVRRPVRGDRTVALVRDGDRGDEAVRIDLELEDHGRELDRVLPPHRGASRLRRAFPARADHPRGRRVAALPGRR